MTHATLYRMMYPYCSHTDSRTWDEVVDCFNGDVDLAAMLPCGDETIVMPQSFCVDCFHELEVRIVTHLALGREVPHPQLTARQLEELISITGDECDRWVIEPFQTLDEPNPILAFEVRFREGKAMFVGGYKTVLERIAAWYRQRELVPF